MSLSTELDRREVIAVAGATALLPLISLGEAEAATAEGALRVGRGQFFDTGWRFFRGAGEGFEAAGADDSKWRRVDLPHDWSIEDVPGGTTGPFGKSSKGGTATGFTLGGEGWYRRYFRTDGLPAMARIEILFDGIYCESDVWLNGQKIGGNVHGYNPHAYDLTPHIKRDGDNVIAVRVRNLGRNSRWYSGSGLYRQVKIDVMPTASHIARWGVAAWTRKIEGGVAEINVTTALNALDPSAILHTVLRNSEGKIVAEASAPASAEVRQSVSVKAPILWSPDQPHLYTLETELRRGNSVIDRITQPFGIRIITMDAKRGLQINGKTTHLRGGCIHHDNGLLGGCAFADADERRVRLLKARGYNAIRSSHNPASHTLRTACDKLGMLMINEAFDMWHEGKEPDDYSKYFKDDWQNVVSALVRSARNSPSVIMWSIGNEIPSRSTPEGVEWEWKLANKIRSLDPTRPVTAALNGLLGPPVMAGEGTARPGFAGKTDNAAAIFLDVPGYNYRLEDIEAEHKEHPERVVYGSETFPNEAYEYQALVERAPYVMGEFVWTAMDYLGEAGIGAAVPMKGAVPFYAAGWPWVNAYCGDIDLIGLQKAASRYRDVVWGISPLEMAVQRPVPVGMHEYVGNWAWSDEIQSWNWDVPATSSKAIAVRVYCAGDRVELRLNGKTMDERTLTRKDKMRTEFILPYVPGRLELVAYRGGKIIAQRRLETVSSPAKLLVAPERLEIKVDRQALAYVPIMITDSKSRFIPDEKRKISITVTGPAELIGFGSANPQAVGSYQSHEAESFQGRALAILRSTGKAGTVRIEARSKGLAGSAATVKLTF